MGPREQLFHTELPEEEQLQGLWEIWRTACIGKVLEG